MRVLCSTFIPPMKPPKTKGTLPLDFVDDKLQLPLSNVEDFLNRVCNHVNEQLLELSSATQKHELISIKPLAESILNGMNIADFHGADLALKKIQEKVSKLQDDEELYTLIQSVIYAWENRFQK